MLAELFSECGWKCDGNIQVRKSAFCDVTKATGTSSRLVTMLNMVLCVWKLDVQSCLADKNPQQHVPLQEYSENLKEIARLLASAGVSADRVIFITPPPIHEQTWEKECLLKGFIPCISFSCFYLHSNCFVCPTGSDLFFLNPSFFPGSPLNRQNSVAGQYAQACVQAANHCGSDVLDLWTLMQKDGQVGTKTDFGDHVI